MFWLILGILCLLGIVLGTLLCEETEGVFLGMSLAAAILAIIGFGMSYMYHASDLGVLRAQSHVIAVQQTRVDRLKQYLQLVGTEGKNLPTALLNHDSPVKAIYDQLALAEKELAASETVRAQALVGITQRGLGPNYIFVKWLGKE